VVAPIYIGQHAIIPAAGDRSTSIRRQVKTREKLVDVPRISRADKLLAAQAAPFRSRFRLAQSDRGNGVIGGIYELLSGSAISRDSFVCR
jgi:hypothetical protein